MNDIRILGNQPTRVETGPIQFGDDWPGVFIRGDNAMAMKMTLDNAITVLPDDETNILVKMHLESFSRLLNSAMAVPSNLL